MKMVNVADKATSDGTKVLVNADAITSVRAGVNRRLVGGGKMQLWKVSFGADSVLVDGEDLTALLGNKSDKKGGA